ncbi:MarR family transcriptional regulator [Eubacteriales bacterium OttesenSCG-928-K08]|nr:MarR family transcriptional regulator [Eubacteriales bacterium OttesenSCG-928-K08]
MRSELQNEFFVAMMRFKKIESALSSECDIPMNELAILKSITGACGCSEGNSVNLNVPEIQEQLQITKPAVSYILSTLEKKGHITREIDPRDRRKISISATEKGSSFAKETSQRYDELWEMILKRFGEDQMRMLVELMLGLTDICSQICEEDS